MDDGLKALDIQISDEAMARIEEESRAYTATLPHFKSFFCRSSAGGGCEMRYEKPTLKLGIAPTRRDLWNNKETNDNYQKILERTKNSKGKRHRTCNIGRIRFLCKKGLRLRQNDRNAGGSISDRLRRCVLRQNILKKKVFRRYSCRL